MKKYATKETTKRRHTSRTGRILELRVHAFMLLLGFDVFIAVDPGCVLDLVVAHKHSLYRLEVKTCTFYKGKKSYSINYRPKRHPKADIIVLGNSKVSEFHFVPLTARGYKFVSLPLFSLQNSITCNYPKGKNLPIYIAQYDSATV